MLIWLYIVCVVQVICVDAVRPPHRPQSPFCIIIGQRAVIHRGAALTPSHWLYLDNYCSIIGYCICQSPVGPPTPCLPPLVMSQLVTPFLLGSSRVQKRRIRFSTGTSNGTSYINLFELSGNRDTCLSITPTQCRQKTWTRTLRWTTRTKNRWVSHCWLDVVG